MSDAKRPPWSADRGGEEQPTILIPNPAGRLGQVAGPPAWSNTAPPPPSAPAREMGVGSPPAGAPGADINPLVHAARPLLARIADIRKTPTEADLMELRRRLERQVAELRNDTKGTGSDQETLKDASYCLCTAIDESVLHTPWGGEGSEWRKLSLLAALHGDAWGGEKFFEILQKRMADPARNIALLELLYLCLALGFEGRYAILPDGQGQSRLADLRRNLYDLIRRQGRRPEPDLSPHWRSEDAARTTLEHPVPVWVVGLVAATLLLGVFAGFRHFLADGSAPVIEQLADVGLHSTAATAVTTRDPGRSPAMVPPPPPSQPALLTAQLRTFLQPEIEQRRVSVLETATDVVVRINGNGLFDPGSDTLLPQYLPLIERIRTALATPPGGSDGGITIVGHTDNQPLKRSLRFQDNYDLSRARAAAVARLLQEGQGLTRTIRLDGKGPLAPVEGGDPQAGNRTPEQRAANRRVEILIEK